MRFLLGLVFVVVCTLARAGDPAWLESPGESAAVGCIAESQANIHNTMTLAVAKAKVELGRSIRSNVFSDQEIKRSDNGVEYKNTARIESNSLLGVVVVKEQAYVNRGGIKYLCVLCETI